MKKIMFLILSFLAIAGAGQFYYMQGGKKILLQPCDKNETLARSADDSLRFLTLDGREIGIPNRLLVKFKSIKNLQKMEKSYHLKQIKKFGSSLFLFEADTPSAAMNAANALSANPDVVFAQPDIISKKEMR